VADWVVTQFTVNPVGVTTVADVSTGAGGTVIKLTVFELVLATVALNERTR